jgi:hypothetical protein
MVRRLPSWRRGGSRLLRCRLRLVRRGRPSAAGEGGGVWGGQIVCGDRPGGGVGGGTIAVVVVLLSRFWYGGYIRLA